jgi:hypothetical protein
MEFHDDSLIVFVVQEPHYPIVEDDQRDVSVHFEKAADVVGSPHEGAL